MLFHPTCHPTCEVDDQVLQAYNTTMEAEHDSSKHSDELRWSSLRVGQTFELPANCDILILEGFSAVGARDWMRNLVNYAVERASRAPRLRVPAILVTQLVDPDEQVIHEIHELGASVVENVESLKDYLSELSLDGFVERLSSDSGHPRREDRVEAAASRQRAVAYWSSFSGYDLSVSEINRVLQLNRESEPGLL